MCFSKKALVVSAALMCFLFLKATECISVEPLPPANDSCELAIGPLSVPSITPGKTMGATFDDVGTCGEFNDNTGPGVWYTVVGTGKRITASTCDPQLDYETYDTKISVFCRSCDEPICIDGNDDDESCSTSIFLSTVTWCSQKGAEYLILVHGFDSEVGDFQLFLSEEGDGQACEPELQCIPVGACCLAGGCLDSLTQVECEEVGGLYRGDDTLCEGGLVYAQEDSDNEFEEFSPSSFDLPNMITVGAVDQAGDETSFTSFGKVDVYSNGFQVESYVPGGDRLPFSGTSMSSPNVVNLAAKLLAVDPSLTPAELREVIEAGCDEHQTGDRTVRLINPKKSMEMLLRKTD